MSGQMNNKLTAKERIHLAKIKEMDCGVCGEPAPSDALHAPVRVEPAPSDQLARTDVHPYIHNKQLIFINPTETVSGDFDKFVSNINKPIMVIPSRWQGVGTLLYTKSMFDGVYTAYSNMKYQTILEQNYKPFQLVYLVRRGHDRRYEFFKYF